MTEATSWQALGAIAPMDLIEPRLQAHWAAQLLAAAADSFAKHEDDDSHSNLGWIDNLQALAGHPLGQKKQVHLALRIEDLTILLLDDHLQPLHELPLAERNLDWARSEVSKLVAARTGGDSTQIALRKYEMPKHPVADGAPFDVSNAAALGELSLWYANAGRALDRIADETSGASDVRCWPHHFDLATLITLDGTTADGHAKTIGVGMSPGDDNYPQPYWYVTPYPYPEGNPTLPPLAGGGTWHRDGWVGAVLVGEAALDGSDEAKGQRDRLAAFHQSAMEACRGILAT